LEKRLCGVKATLEPEREHDWWRETKETEEKRMGMEQSLRQGRPEGGREREMG